MLFRKLKLTAALFLSLIMALTASAMKGPVLIPDPIQHFIKFLHKQYDFNEQELTQLFSQTHIDHSLIEKMNHPYEEKAWSEYQKFFITRERIDGGNAFWEQHRAALQQAEKKYGVPANVIVAILGVETFYGQHVGLHPVMDTLTTLSFYYPRREKFFRKELTEYLLLTREQKLEPLRLKGSYAGAIGIPQFMPSTYRQYAVGFSDHDNVDLVNNTNDAIFSIANYLHRMGWKRKQPIAAPLKITHTLSEALISDSAKPTKTLATLQRHGVSLPKNAAHPKLKAAIIQLGSKTAHAKDYWITYPNFRAIMMYNPRIHYAMAVYQLSEAIKNAHEHAKITTRTKIASAGKTG